MNEDIFSGKENAQLQWGDMGSDGWRDMKGRTIVVQWFSLKESQSEKIYELREAVSPTSSSRPQAFDARVTWNYMQMPTFQRSLESPCFYNTLYLCPSKQMSQSMDTNVSSAYAHKQGKSSINPNLIPSKPRTDAPVILKVL